MYWPFPPTSYSSRAVGSCQHIYMNSVRVSCVSSKMCDTNPQSKDLNIKHPKRLMQLTLCLNVSINDICVCEIIVWLNSDFELIHIVIEQNQCKYKSEKASYYILIENDSRSQHNNANYEPATYFKPFFLDKTLFQIDGPMSLDFF